MISKPAAVLAQALIALLRWDLRDLAKWGAVTKFGGESGLKDVRLPSIDIMQLSDFPPCRTQALRALLSGEMRNTMELGVATKHSDETENTIQSDYKGPFQKRLFQKRHCILQKLTALLSGTRARLRSWAR